jgi:hypothetical protein
VGVPDATQGFKKSSVKFLQQMTACAACRVELSPRSHVMLTIGDRRVQIIDFRLNMPPISSIKNDHSVLVLRREIAFARALHATWRVAEMTVRFAGPLHRYFG